MKNISTIMVNIQGEITRTKTKQGLIEECIGLHRENVFLLLEENENQTEYMIHKTVGLIETLDRRIQRHERLQTNFIKKHWRMRNEDFSLLYEHQPIQELLCQIYGSIKTLSLVKSVSRGVHPDMIRLPKGSLSSLARKFVRRYSQEKGVIDVGFTGISIDLESGEFNMSAEVTPKPENVQERIHAIRAKMEPRQRKI